MLLYGVSLLQVVIQYNLVPALVILLAEVCKFINIFTNGMPYGLVYVQWIIFCLDSVS